MTAFLRVNENGRTRDVAVIPSGRSLIVGRSETVDVPFPHDLLMSSRHLSIQLQDLKCLICDLQSTNGTTVNGLSLESALVGPGDVFCCGATVFSVDWPSSAEPVQPPANAGLEEQTLVSGTAPDSSEASRTSRLAELRLSPGNQAALGPDVAPTKGYASKSAEDILKRFRLRQSIPLTPEQDEATDAFREKLQRFPDGTAEIEFLAFALPKRCAVWWLIVCARELTSLREEEVAVLELGEKWVIEPIDRNRRALFAASQGEDPGRIAHWVGSAAYFSGGSIAPENSPVVAPQDRVTGQCVLAGITMAVLQGSVEDLKSRRKAMSQMAVLIAADGIQMAKKT